MGELKIKLDGVWQPALPVGTPGAPGPPGPAGAAGPAGAQGLPGGALPVGGLEGDVLVKTDQPDFATAWDATAHTGRILWKQFQGPWNGTGSAAWTVTLEARDYLLMFNGAGHSAAIAARDAYIQMDGVLKGNSRLWFNVVSQHSAMHTATTILTGVTAGDHTFTMHNGASLVSDSNDYGFCMLVPL